MADAFDTLELAAALNDDDRELTINDLPKELLVSIFIAVELPFWVRHTVSLVCKDWAELYCSKDASPLHETLEIDFWREAERVAAAREGEPRGRLGANT